MRRSNRAAGGDGGLRPVFPDFISRAVAGASPVTCTCLGPFIKEHRLGRLLVTPIDVILSEDTVLQPDVLFIARENLAVYDRQKGVVRTPDLVIEILPPSTATRAIGTKRRLFAQHGVSSPLLPGLKLNLAEVFAN